MKYTLSNTINSPLHRVAERISDPEGVKYWTEELRAVKQTLGKYCDVGSKRNLHYFFKNKELIITESILEHNLPQQIKFAYDSKMGRNVVELLFEELSENEVKQTSNTTMELKGMMKLFGFALIGMFKKQSRMYMAGFKKYAEE